MRYAKGYAKRYIVRMLIAFVVVNIVNNGALLEKITTQVKNSYSNGKEATNNSVKVIKKAPKEKIVNKTKKVITHIEKSEPSFTLIKENKPVLWCVNKINLEINKDNMPEGALVDLNWAIDEIEKKLSIRLEIIGETLSKPMRGSYQREEGIPAVILGWSTFNETDLLPRGASGAAVANPAKIDGEYRLVTGAVVFNTDHDKFYRPGNGSGMHRGNLYLHELLHIVGLGHSEQKNDIMFTHINQETSHGLDEHDSELLKDILACNP